MSKTIFLDTSFAYALINKSDEWHNSAISLEEIISKEKTPLLTTEYVLCEIANGLSDLRYKDKAINLIKILYDSQFIKIIDSSSELFKEGLDLFGRYIDKDFSLTDCISFIIMKKYGISEALSSDHHFEQMGFISLMKK